MRSLNPTTLLRPLSIAGATIALCLAASGAPAQPRIVTQGSWISIGGHGMSIERRAAHPDVAPCELEIEAYRTGNTVLLVIRGANTSAGYSTYLTRGDTRRDGAHVVLRNTPPRRMSAAAITPFRLSASLRASSTAREVSVRVADRVHRVRIVDAPSL